ERSPNSHWGDLKTTTLKAVRPCARQPCPRKIMIQNLAVTHPALRRPVRAFLTEPEPMAEAAPAKDKIIARPQNFKPRVFDHLPSQTSSDDEFEIPAANHASSRAFDGDHLGPARRVAFGDGDRIEPRAGVRALVAPQRLCELIRRDLLRPPAV